MKQGTILEKNTEVVIIEMTSIGTIASIIHGRYIGRDGVEHKIQSIENDRIYFCYAREFHLKSDYDKYCATQYKKLEMVKCDCGHTVNKNEILNSSLGTSCTDCYSRMSA